MTDLNTQLEKDIKFIKEILPSHYEVKESKETGNIHCKSKIGIRHKIDADDDEHWDYIVKAMEQYFDGRLSEIFHNTNFCHVDFTIYLSKRVLIKSSAGTKTSNTNPIHKIQIICIESI